ncbi:MAG: hypothetical protein OHK0046_41920 [Anaerolineae bacterium]
MATYRAIAATTQAIMDLLRNSWQEGLINVPNPRFEVFRTTDFSEAMSAGVSLFLYQVKINSVQRTIPRRPGLQGQLQRPELALDLHMMLTPWAQGASVEQEILGWMMRTLEDNPVISGGALPDDVFLEGETIEIIKDELILEELFRIWDVLPTNFQISVPYLARVVRIQSLLDTQGEGVVLTRDLRFGKGDDR